MIKTIKINGMHCGACAARVTNALNALDGVTAEVFLDRGCAVADTNVSDDVLKNTVEDLGFDVISMNHTK